MRRVLFVAAVLVLLMGTYSTVFAEPPVELGGDFIYFGFPFEPNEEVDVLFYRYSTLGGWPTGWTLQNGTWWWTGPASEQRRQLAGTADELGFFYAEFMIPRDEAWFPCSYPFKWKCNTVLYPGDPINDPIVDFHSPVSQGNFEAGLVWPWYASWLTGQAAWDAANPMDTVSPLETCVVSDSGTGGCFWWEVTGYFWKWTDLEDGWHGMPLP